MNFEFWLGPNAKKTLKKIGLVANFWAVADLKLSLLAQSQIFCFTYDQKSILLENLLLRKRGTEDIPLILMLFSIKYESVLVVPNVQVSYLATCTRLFSSVIRTKSTIINTSRHSDRLPYPLRDYALYTVTKLVALGLGNSSVSVRGNREGTQSGFLSQVIHDLSYWGSCWRTYHKRDDVIDSQWNCRIGRILGMTPYGPKVCPWCDKWTPITKLS